MSVPVLVMQILPSCLTLILGFLGGGFFVRLVGFWLLRQGFSGLTEEGNARVGSMTL